MCSYRYVFINVWKLQRKSSSTSLFLKFLAFLGILLFHLHFEICFSISENKLAGIWESVCADPLGGHIATLIVFNLQSMNMECLFFL